MTYRDKALRETARDASCSLCGAHDGTVVWAHSNLLEHGKGRGLKASDAAGGLLCGRCHYELDQGNKLSKAERRAMTFEMIAKTYIRLVEAGRLRVVP